jgi:hypothetical protein
MNATSVVQGSASTSVPAAFQRHVASLEMPGKADDEALDEWVGRNSPFRRFLWLLGYHSSEAVTIRGATGLYEAVCKQCDADSLHNEVQLQPSFYSRWCEPFSAFPDHCDLHFFVSSCEELHP